jgi:tRNA nucleotidyltransferase (CCA-adding enzyme)
MANARPAAPSEAVALAGGHDPVTLILARAMGGAWLDRYQGEWRHVRLEIDGNDLLEAGVPEGPEIGRGLEAALRGKLDGEIAGREAELEAALAAAREVGG